MLFHAGLLNILSAPCCINAMFKAVKIMDDSKFTKNMCKDIYCTAKFDIIIIEKTGISPYKMLKKRLNTAQKKKFSIRLFFSKCNQTAVSSVFGYIY